MEEGSIVKPILWHQMVVKLPNLDSNQGNGTLMITNEKYHEYMYKLDELMKLAVEITKDAENQGLLVVRG